MRYRVEVTREDGWWMIAIPEIDGLTQARRLDDVETEASDYICADQNLAPGGFTVEVVSVRAGAVDVSSLAATVRAQRSATRAAEAELAVVSRRAAAELASADIPVRDIGRLLEVSHQRAHQLLESR